VALKLVKQYIQQTGWVLHTLKSSFNKLQYECTILSTNSFKDFKNKDYIMYNVWVLLVPYKDVVVGGGK
jgi:hypothetical protein